MVYGIDRTLLEQPYLSQAECDLLDDEAQALVDLIKPIREAEPIFPSLQMAAEMAAREEEEERSED